jgi:hypothetical protein
MGVVKPGVNVINYFLFSFEIARKRGRVFAPGICCHDQYLPRSAGGHFNKFVSKFSQHFES